MVYSVMRMTLGPLLKLLLKEVNGIGNIPAKPPFIIASNHCSYIDPLLIMAIIIPRINKKIHFLALKNKNWELFGDTISEKWMGCIPLTEDRQKAYKDMLDCLRQNEIVGLFPEGSHADDGNIKKAKLGIAKIAIESRVPILPIGLKGTFDIAPGNKIVPSFRRAVMNIGKPFAIKTKSNGKKTLEQQTRVVMKKIAKLAGQEYIY